MPQSLSTTGFSDASVCLKKYQYRHVDQLVPAPRDLSPRIRKGLWLHYALAEESAGRSVVAALLHCREWAMQHGVPEEHAEELHQECVQLLRGYFTYWAKHPDECWESVLAVEEPIRVTLPSGVILQATIDKLVLWRGRQWLVEHKSTSDIPSPSWRSVDPQTALQYAACLLSKKYQPVGILFDYLLTKLPPVPQIKNDGQLYATSLKSVTTTAAFALCEQEIREKWKPTAEYPDAQKYIDLKRAAVVHDGAFYTRYFVQRPIEAIKQSLLDYREVCHAIDRAATSGHYPRLNNLLYCQRFCSYSKLCVSEYISGGISQGMRDYEFERDNPDDREGR